MGAPVVSLSVGKLVGYLVAVLVGVLVGETVGVKLVRTSMEADKVTGASVGDEPSLAVSAPPSVINLLKALKDIRCLPRMSASFGIFGLNCEAST